MDNQNSSQQQMFAMSPSISKEDFLKLVVEKLKYKKWQEEAIKKLDVSQLKLKYIAGYQYTGTADCNYSCKVAHKMDVTINQKKSTITPGSVVNGEFNDQQFDFLVPNLQTDIPCWAKVLLFPVQIGNLHPFKEGEISDADIYSEKSDEPLELWMKNGNQLVDNWLRPAVKAVGSSAINVYNYLGIISNEEAVNMALSGFKMSVDMTDWNIKSRNSLSSYKKKVLIPYYVLEFDYENQHHYISGAADNLGIVAYNVPLREVDDPQLQAEAEMPEKVSLVKKLKWGWVLAILLFFIFNFMTAIIALIAWKVALWFVKKSISDRAKALQRQEDAYSKRVENALAKQLGI